MIKVKTLEVDGWRPAIIGMRNPMNSWAASDSEFYADDGYAYTINGDIAPSNNEFIFSDVVLGKKDVDLMLRLAKTGTADSKYRRMITVYADIIAPLYWWKEYDTYKVGTVTNSCSTMHKIAEKEFALDDFSHEHLDYNNAMVDASPYKDESIVFSPYGLLKIVILSLNECRRLYLETKDKKYWWEMIQLLPTSYNQKRTVMLNYEVLSKQYKERRNHKLDEWREYCDWIVTLPYSFIITE